MPPPLLGIPPTVVRHAAAVVRMHPPLLSRLPPLLSMPPTVVIYAAAVVIGLSPTVVIGMPPPLLGMPPTVPMLG